MAPVLILLGIFGYLPNQSRRVYFDQLGIARSVSYLDRKVQDFGGGGTGNSPEEAERRIMSLWLSWINTGGNSIPDQRLVYVRQNEPFSQDYRTFKVRIRTLPKYKVRDSIAFLVKGDDGLPYRPVYRQLAFRMEDYRATDTFFVEGPNRGERIVLILSLELKPEIKPPAPVAAPAAPSAAGAIGTPKPGAVSPAEVVPPSGTPAPTPARATGFPRESPKEATPTVVVSVTRSALLSDGLPYNVEDFGLALEVVRESQAGD